MLWWPGGRPSNPWLRRINPTTNGPHHRLPGAVTRPWFVAFLCVLLGFPDLYQHGLLRGTEQTDAGGIGQGLLRLDGTRIEGGLLAIADGSVVVMGQAEPVPLYELRALLLAEPEGEVAAKPPIWNDGPLVVFRYGERVKARVLH